MLVETTVSKKYFFPDNLQDSKSLQQILLKCSLINLFIVAVIGVLLRAFPFIYNFPLSFKNLLHGHSHFAFAGWVMPALLALILNCFPAIEKAVAYKHWRNIAFLLLFSAYGMLISFPLQGYKAISIFFSTLSILSGWYLAVIVCNAARSLKTSVAINFLSAGLFYLVFSSIGPFATGPLIAMGKAGTSLYFDAIYFFLHFQYNGWFLFAVLAFFYQYLEQRGIMTNGRKVFRLLNLACIPTYFLSILWHQPSILFNVLAGIGALVQCFALIYLLRDLRLFKFENGLATTLVQFSFASLALKILLQFFSAIPAVAVLAYNYRNFVIAYLHLVLLGCISLFLIGWSMKSFSVAITKASRTGIALFIIGFVCTELLLIAAPLGGIINYTIPYYSWLLLALSILLPVGIAIVAMSFRQGNRIERGCIYASNVLRVLAHTQGQERKHRRKSGKTLS